MRGYKELPSKFKPAYHLGIKSMYFLRNDLFLNFGLVYQQKVDALNFPNTENLIDQNGNVNLEEVTNYTATFNNNYWTVPLSVNYSIWKTKSDKITFFTSGGIEFNCFHFAKITSDIPEIESTIVRMDEFKNRISSSFSVGAGLLYQVSPHFLVTLLPEYSYDFYVSNKTEPKFHSLRLNLEIHYKLGRD